MSHTFGLTNGKFVYILFNLYFRNISESELIFIMLFLDYLIGILFNLDKFVREPFKSFNVFLMAKFTCYEIS